MSLINVDLPAPLGSQQAGDARLDFKVNAVERAHRFVILDDVFKRDQTRHGSRFEGGRSVQDLCKWVVRTEAPALGN